MALFKSRKENPEAAASAVQPESVESLRRRARQRLIGAAVLVLIGVVGFPLLFDTQPRPIPVDIPIEIPDRNKSRNLPVTQASPEVAVASPPTAVPAPPALGPAVAEPVAAGGAAPATQPATVSSVPAAAAVGPREEVVPPAAPKAEPTKPSASNDGARAKALLEGKPEPSKSAADTAPPSDRFVVQVGAYADSDKARDVRRQLERAGLKTYTHIAETSEGKRIRVRVGPFPTRAEADKVAQKVKSLGLPVAVLVL